MKKSDKKTETASEEVKPVEEVNAEAAVPGEAPATDVKAEEAKAEEAKTEDVKTEEQPAEPTEEKNGKNSFFSNKRNIAVVACASAAVVALSLGLGLGLGLKGKEEKPSKIAFPAPTGVAVDGSTISWTAVDNATGGYTLKFAESDKTMTLNVVTYDLLSDKSYLTEGTNTLSVMVNATETYLASAYSATVTYTYTVPAEKTAFATPAATLDGDTLKWNAVEGATNGYTVKIGEKELDAVTATSLDLTTVKDKLVSGENKIYVKVNATDLKNESAYSAAVTYTYTPAEKTAFATPAATLDGDTLKWNAVEGATNGYTVKIGTRELDPITDTSLDLTTVVDTSVTSDYKVSVKVNATDLKNESAYSDEIDYTYTHVNPKFAAPANVKVESNTLSWDAVDGAASYTVKIVNADGTAEHTMEVATASVDLTSDEAKAKLFNGVNKFYVMANATTDHNASDYSAADNVTYTYTPSIDELVEAYGTLVDEIGSITSTSTLAQATAVKTAIKAAEDKYAELVEAGATEQVTDEKSTFDEKKKAYEDVYTPAKASHDAYINAINAAKTVADAEEDYAALITAVGTADSAKPADGTLALNMVSAEEAQSHTGVKNTLAEWKTAVDAAKEVWKDVTAESFASVEYDIEQTGPDEITEVIENAEANIVKANGLVEQYPDKKYVQTAALDDSTLISAKKAIVDKALTDSKEAIDDIVETLQGELENFTGVITEDNITKGYYDILSLYLGLTEAFGDYANTKWTAADTKIITDEIAALLALPDPKKLESNSSQPIYNSFNAENTTLFVVRRYLNVLGNKPVGFTLPTVVASDGVTVTAPDDANDDGEYVWKLTFASPETDDGASISNTVTVKYTVAGEDEQTVGVTIGYKTSAEGTHVNTNVYGGKFENGKLYFSKVQDLDGAEVYMDVYESKNVTYGPAEANDVVIKGKPLAQELKVTAEMSEDAFKVLLAKQGIRSKEGEKLNLTFLLYQKATVVDAETKKDIYSSITSNSLFNKTYDSITDEDAVARLYFGNTDEGIEITTDGGFISGAHFGEQQLVSLFDSSEVTSATVRNYLRFHVYIYKDGEDLCDFYAPVNNTAEISGSTLKCAVYNFSNGDVNGKITISVALALSEGSEFELRESLPTKPSEWKRGDTEFTATENDLKLTIDLGTNNYKCDSTDGSFVYGRYEVVTDEAGFHDGLSVLAYEITDGTDKDSYDFVTSATPFASYVIDSASSPLDWAKVKEAIDKKWKSLPDDQRVGEKQFVIVLRKLPNEEGEALGFIPSDAVYVMTSSDGRIVLNVKHDDRLSLNSNRGTGEELGIYFTIDGTTELSGNLDFAWEAGSDNKDLKEGGGMTVFVYEVKDGMDAQTTQFHDPYNYQNNLENAFTTLVYEGGKFLTWEVINEKIDAEWLKVATSGVNTKQFVFVFQNVVNEAGREAGYIDSRAAYITASGTGHPRTVLTYTRNYSATNENQFRMTPNNDGYVELVRSTGGNGKAFEGARHIVLYATKNEQTLTMYMVKDGDNLYLSTSDSYDAETALVCGTLLNGNCSIATFNSWVNGKFSDEVTDFDGTKDWKFTTQIIADGTNGVLFDGEVSSPYVCDFAYPVIKD